eukprot:CAMPEP_0183421782 /NCGR_PEP_ID=MMETSP0370-20130417/27342_1 /TAXON_ID=268820 /ORGANISM="Peridinium aciculiferum, Strain PAER-2" /LENGTH=68 /DNA_ID=CAMNT_0025605813 /DNA_START=110 /DNA_END=313 /DNA_ORIENTATION=-
MAACQGQHILTEVMTTHLWSNMATATSIATACVAKEDAGGTPELLCSRRSPCELPSDSEALLVTDGVP